MYLIKLRGGRNVKNQNIEGPEHQKFFKDDQNVKNKDVDQNVENQNVEKNVKSQQDLLGQVSRLRKREGQKYVNFYGKSWRTKVILKTYNEQF